MIVARKRKTTPVEGRFWPKVLKTPDHWLWTGYVNPKGYGYFQRTRAHSPEPAHRVAWDLSGLPLPTGGLVIGSDCGLRLCVRPDHHTVVREGRRRKGTT